MITLSNLEQALREALSPISITITDKSNEHRHHSGWKKDHITHIDVLIISEKFLNQSKIQRHKLVYLALSDFFKNGLHAVSITALTRDES